MVELNDAGEIIDGDDIPLTACDFCDLMTGGVINESEIEFMKINEYPSSLRLTLEKRRQKCDSEGYAIQKIQIFLERLISRSSTLTENEPGHPHGPKEGPRTRTKGGPP